MNLSFYIAKRYLLGKKSQNAINIISSISVLGVATGTMALVIVLSVFNGFDQDELYDLRSDPDEMTNLARQPVYREKLAELDALLNRALQGDRFGQ